MLGRPVPHRHSSTRAQRGDSPFARALTAWIAVVALTVSALAAAPASAAEPAASADEVDITGILKVLPDETGGSGENIVTLVTADGAEAELTGDAVDGVVSGDRFDGTVAVAEPVADVIDEVTAEQVTEASEQLDIALEVLEADVTPATMGAVAAKTHTVEIMYIRPSGAALPAASAFDGVVARLGEFWTSQSNGQLAGVTRIGNVKTATMSPSGMCDPETTWAYAAGPNGFNRSAVPGASGPDSYYWAGNHATHLVVIVPGSVCGAGSGLGSVGNVHAGGVTWSSVDPDPLDWDQVVFHEIGHNLGLGHSNVTECQAPVTDGPTCTQHEYYDFYDVMGGGMNYAGVVNSRNIASLNVSQKVNLDALPRGGSSPSLRTVTAADGDSQQFTINPASDESGLRGLEVVNQNTGEHLFVEYRSGTGRDAQSFYVKVGSKTDVYSPGVRILKIDCSPGAYACAGASSTVLRNGTRLSYRASESFTTADCFDGRPGANVSVVSTTATSAVVAVNYGASECPPTPTVTGAPKVGVPLTAEPGAWENGTPTSYRWLAGGSAVSGATGKSFTPTAAQLGKTLQVAVTWTRTTTGTMSSTSVKTAAVASGTLTAPTPTISGTAKVGLKLTVKPGTWTSGTALNYRWYVNGNPVSGATNTTFTPRASDAGKKVTVNVAGRKTGYTTVAKASKSTAAVAKASTLRTSTPVISGTVQVKKTLTVKTGTWTSGTSFTYRWYVGGKAVSGATKTKFTLRSSDRGKTVRVHVTGKKAGYTTVTKISRATAKVK